MRDGGILTLYALTNVQNPGMMPVEALVERGTAFFSYRSIGVTRMYAALGANRQIDALVRCWNTTIPDDAKYAVIDGEQFRIDIAQPEGDAVDLTLVKLEDFYDIATS